METYYLENNKTLFIGKAREIQNLVKCLQRAYKKDIKKEAWVSRVIFKTGDYPQGYNGIQRTQLCPMFIDPKFNMGRRYGLHIEGEYWRVCGLEEVCDMLNIFC